MWVSFKTAQFVRKKLTCELPVNLVGVDLICSDLVWFGSVPTNERREQVRVLQLVQFLMKKHRGQ